MARPKISKAFSLRKEDLLKSGRNALIFAGPALLVLIASFVDLVPEGAQWGVVVLYLINVVADLFRKWLKENKY